MVQIFPEPRLERSLADDEEAEVLAAQLQESFLQLDQNADVLFHGKAAYKSKRERARGSIPLLPGRSALCLRRVATLRAWLQELRKNFLASPRAGISCRPSPRPDSG